MLQDFHIGAMEFFSLSLLLLFSVLFVSLSLQYLLHKHTTTKLPLPPGKTGWPLIGETMLYLSMGKKGILQRFFEDRKNKYSPKIFKTSLLGETMAILCSAEGNKFLFSNEDKLVRSWWPGSFQKLFPSSETTMTLPDEAKRFLTFFIPSYLKPDQLQKHIGTMDSVTKQHLREDWINHQEVKVYPLARKHTFTLGCQLFMNIEDPELVEKLHKPFCHLVAGMFSVPINLPGTRFSRGVRAVSELRKEIEVMIKQRRMAMSEKSDSPAAQDMLSLMLCHTFEDGQFMNEWDIANKIIGILIAANDSSSVALVTIVDFLAKLPDVYERVLKEQMEIANSKGPGELLNWEDIKKMRYSWNVACEASRIYPPLPGTYREAITDFTYEGYQIPKGWKVHWNAYATHMNPEYFPDPERFDPSRFEGNGPPPYSYVPFGGGPRMCPGKEFARLQILVFMHNLVTSFKWEKVFQEEKLVNDPLLVPEKGLPVRIYPHPNKPLVD